MARPTLPALNVGASGWGPDNLLALQQLYNTPNPLPQFSGDETTITSTYPPALYDRCVVWVNHTELGYVLYYSTGAVWAPLLQPPSPELRRWSFDDLTNYSSSSGSVHPFAVTELASGLAVPTALAGTLGALRIASAASANSGAIIRTLDTVSILGETGAASVVIAAYTGAFATASLARIGFIDTADHQECVDGAYFLLSGGVVAARAISNSTGTTSGTTFTPTINVVYRHVIRYTSTTAVRFRIYEHLTGTKVYDQTVSTNVPTGTTRAFGVGAVATTTASAAANHIWVDALGFGPALPVEFLA